MIMTLAGKFDLASLLAPCRFHKSLTRQFDRLIGAESRSLAPAPRAAPLTTSMEGAHGQ